MRTWIVISIAVATGCAQVDDDADELGAVESALAGGIRCGETTCSNVTGTPLGSHFTERGCTGRELYYTPYLSGTTQPNPDKIRHTWDGHGLSGTSYRTVAVRSFKDAAGVCHDDWPNGNTLNYLVNIYRTLDGCPVDYHRQNDVFYAQGNGSDRRLSWACVRPIAPVTCAGLIDPATGTPANAMHPDFDWMYSTLDSQFQPYLLQRDICQSPSNNNSWMVPSCEATPTIVTLFGVGADRCAYLDQ